MTEYQTTPQQTQLKILLIGDICTDIYQYGSVDRISPEAPVPIFNKLHSVRKNGMAANVKDNLEKFNCKVDICCSANNSIKTRLIDIRSNQHILRIDEDVKSSPLVLEEVDSSYDAVVISDYNKGAVSYELIEHVRRVYSGPIFVDTKKTNLAKFEGCIVKINNKEYNDAVTHCSDLIVTNGASGVNYKNKIFSVPQVDVFDVCGAGDTFLASLAVAFCQTKEMAESIRFAIRASTVTVQKLGVYAPSIEEINAINWTR
jgi:D-beta-D-heptose 7-phosphate kinase/D-beta-D-heptose 1-phosphate adenosyltransferase